MLIYNERFKLRESDFDEFDNLKPSAFLDFFQSVASTHATLKGMGFDDMIKKNIAWVLTKVKLDAYKRVKAKDTIIVETIPRPKGLIDYTRDYYIYDEENELIAKGSSQWVHIDFTTRKLLRPTIDFTEELSPRDAYETRKIERVPAVDTYEIGKYVTTRNDTDHNGHVNNLRYADMVLAFEKKNPAPVRSFIINFSVESHENETLTIYSDGDTLFTGKKQDGTVSFTAKLIRANY